MNRRIILLNLALVALAGALVWILRTNWIEAKARERAVLQRKVAAKAVLVPPALRPDHSAEIQQIGEKAGVPVWVLSPPGDFPPSYFRDGFHLNAVGSGIFTTRLSKQLASLPVAPTQSQP